MAATIADNHNPPFPGLFIDQGSAVQAAPPALYPLGSWLQVQLLDPEEVLPSGLILPQGSIENWTDAVVLEAGYGRQHRESGIVEVVFARPGDRVVFRAPEFFPAYDRARWGFVQDSDVVMLLPGPDHVEPRPANGWVSIRPDRAETQSQGGIETPDEYRRRPLHGTVLDAGQGTMRTTGAYAGTRKSCWHQVGRPRHEVTGRRVHWSPTTEVIEITGDDDCVELILVRAADLIAIEEE